MIKRKPNQRFWLTIKSEDVKLLTENNDRADYVHGQTVKRKEKVPITIAM